MKNITDLMVNMAKDPELGKEFIKRLHEGNPADLAKWLKSEGYDVEESECKKFHENKDNIKKSSAVGFAY